MRNMRIEYSRNNSKTAIRISAEGPNDQAELIETVLVDGSMVEKVFVFGETRTWTDQQGQQRFDHRMRGLLAGTWEEGNAWLERFRKAGATVIEQSFFVPLSNGYHRFGKDENGATLQDYLEAEILGCRIDTTLLEHVAKVLETQKAENAYC